MKKIILLLLTISSITSFAQNNEVEKPLYSSISLTGGIAIPVGDFADAELGGANGVNLNFQFNYLIKENLAVSFATIYTNNSDNLSGPSATVVLPNYKIESTDWSTTNFLLGVTGILPLTKSLSINGSILGGLSISTSPETTVSYDQGESKIKNVNGKGRTGSFGYQFKVGPNYQLSTRTKLTLDFAYLATTAKFKDVQFKSTADGVLTSSSKTTFEQQIAFTTINLGIIFKL